MKMIFFVVALAMLQLFFLVRTLESQMWLVSILNFLVLITLHPYNIYKSIAFYKNGL